jgi:tetratricopeptide (TPR) repeat protein
MTIYHNLLDLSDEDLIKLTEIVKNGSNKDQRWISFSESDIYRKIGKGYDIKKSDFLYPDGIESLTRDFVKNNKNDYISNINILRQSFSQKVEAINKANPSLKRKSKTKWILAASIVLVVAGFIVNDYFQKFSLKSEILAKTSSISALSSLGEIEKAIKDIEEFLEKYKNDEVFVRKNTLLDTWKDKTDSTFKSPSERDLFKEVSAIPFESFQDNMIGYEKLTKLDPQNDSYKQKYTKYKNLYEEEKNYLDNMSLIPNNYYSCNRGYSETSRSVTSTSTGSSSLNYNILTGKVSVKPGKVTEYKNTITSSMDDRVFFKFCAVGARSNPRTAACPYYMECVSAVHHKKNRLKGAPGVYSFEKVAKILRDDRIEQGILKPSVTVPRGKHAYNKPDLWLSDVKNFKNACDVVSSTYSGNVVAAEIYKHVPEVTSFSVAQKLGDKAVEGYGECNCVLQNYTGIEQVMSIGYCNGEAYIDY